MRLIWVVLGLILALSTCQAYDATQQAMIDGTALSWKMAIAYDQQDTAKFNALADQWNAWVRQNFGEDPNLLMPKMNAPTDLTKPVVMANNTAKGGIIHAIDGSSQANASYTTNDMNLLPASVTNSTTFQNGGGGQWLGGV